MKKFWMENQKLLYRIAMAAVGICFLATRLWKLDSLPMGLHIDEAGMAYDAWCLANFGVDRWMKAWPVYLDNFGAGQSSLYAFLCAGLFKVFGFSVWLVRLPIFVFSALTLVFGCKLAKRVFEDDKVMIFFTAVLITFGPYMIMQSRYGLDCDLMLGASTVFLYFFVSAVSEGQAWRYAASGVAGGVMLYTYALSYLILPLFLVLALVYVVAVRKFSLRRWICMGGPMFLVAWPLIVTQVVNIFELNEFKVGPITIPRIKYYRASTVERFRFKWFLLALKNTFIGDDSVYASIPGVRNLYAITIPLFVIGFAGMLMVLGKKLKTRTWDGIAVPFLWFVAVLLFESHLESCTYRINMIFLAVIIIAVYGIRCIGKWLPKLYPWAAVGILAVYAVCSLRFGGFYFLKYNQETFPLPYFGCMTKEAFEIIEGNETLRQKLTFDSEFGIYYVLCMEVPPQEFEIIGDDHVEWRGYWFGSLQEIRDDCNYIVCGDFEEYREELRASGFTEVAFDNYALYYKE
ncbi:MAG: glycosyltransferase family 39 protein [Lachnospiraceae bacterium]|nr:glycosyltransferase family 39 protein [Lachnospiraceae bacterium]